MYLGMLIRTALRAVEVSGYISDLIPAGSGILAGCTQSMSGVKMYVYELLHHSHIIHPSDGLRYYVGGFPDSRLIAKSLFVTSWCLLPSSYATALKPLNALFIPRAVLLPRMLLCEMSYLLVSRLPPFL